MSLDIVSLVLIMGAMNGLVLGGLLWNVKNANPMATRVFSAIVLMFAMLIADELVDYMNLELRYPHLTSLSDGFILIINPLLLLYAYLITERKKKLVKIDFLHLIPFLAFIGYLMPFYLLPGSEKSVNANYDPNGTLSLIKTFITLCYFVLTLIHINRYGKNRWSKSFPRNNHKNIRWFRAVMWSFIVTGVVTLAFGAINPNGVNYLIDADTASVLLLSIIFYVNSFVLIKNPFILWGTESFDESISDINTKVLLNRRERYKTSPLDQTDLRMNVEKLVQLMRKEKPYLDPELNPQQLEHLTGIKSYYISQTLSEVLDKNFYEFVNAFRVEESKRKILDPKESHKTILALALESGFNSKSSFNRAFKNFTGLTPSQFKKKFGE